MSPEQESSLTGGGDCFLHWHSEDRRATQDLLHGLQGVARQRIITGDTTLAQTDDFALVSGNVQITLPLSGRGNI